MKLSTLSLGSSLAKYAPFDVKFDFREVTNPEGLGYIATALGARDPIKITKLKFRINLGSTDAVLKNNIKRFFKSLKEYPHLTHLDLGYCQISDWTIREYVQPMLECNKSITVLKLNDNLMTDHGVRLVFSALENGSDSKVEELTVAMNDFTHECMEAVGACVARDKFTVLDFSHSRLGAEGIKILKPYLKSASKLKSLQMENVQMGDEGCLQIASLLAEKELKGVEILNLCENNIGRVGIEKLCANFIPKDQFNQVKSLDISKNYFGDEGFAKVMEMMQKNSSLLTLKINRCGFSIAKFNDFCEKMTQRYNEVIGPYPEITHLEVGSNGLGNEIDTLATMLKHKNCAIEVLIYEKNEVSNFGAKKWAEFLNPSKNKGVNFCDRRKFKDEVQDSFSSEAQRQDFLKNLDDANRRRRDFIKLGLRGNAITEDGAENLAPIVNKNKVFYELDMRNNNIGVKGAIFFKKEFRKRQADADNFGRTFKFHIMPSDVGLEGVNHLAIGIRESPALLKKWVLAQPRSETYIRHPAIEDRWRKASGLIGKKDPANTENETSLIKTTKEKLPQLNLEQPICTPRKMQNQFHGSYVQTRFSRFDTPMVSSKNRLNMSEYKFGIEIEGENLEKIDEWFFTILCTYWALGIMCTDRGIYKWHPFVWTMVKRGWGSALLGNTLYRFGILVRLGYLCEDENYIRDLYVQRYIGFSNISGMLKVYHDDVDKLIQKLALDDISHLYHQLIPQTKLTQIDNVDTPFTMFEWVLKYSASPVIDCVRQFINVYPAVETQVPFLEQTIARSGETYRTLCAACNDRFVKRYAEAKDLTLFRFLEVEPIYNSRFVKISKVEDLLLTEEYNDDERFFFMRKIAPTTAQEDDKLAQNEFDTHLSFQSADGSYLSKDKTLANVENWILPNKNKSLDVEFIPMVSLLYNRKQYLTGDKLAPTFSICYKNTLRDVLDNQCIAGGRNLGESQIILRMIAEALEHFNTKAWVDNWDKRNVLYPDLRQLELIGKPRIHGNVKPRNIVYKSDYELPDLDKGIDFLPPRWVLSDFTRSTVHDESYYPIVDSGYNPPEVAKRSMTSEANFTKKVPANEKMDVWQFGCVLYEMLSGTTLFKMEARDDTLLLEKERNELVNWLSLDEERSSLILNQLENYNSEIYDKEELKKIIASGKQLCEMCLQGRPEDRPTIVEVLNHPFLKDINPGKLKPEKEADAVLTLVQTHLPVPSIETAFSNSRFLQNQPHVHLMNTDFEQAGLVVKSLQHSIEKLGCRMTTDSIDYSANDANLELYEKNLRKNVESARVIACLLTRDVFLKPNIVKQILYAEDFRKKDEKVHGRILFIDLGSTLNLEKDNLKWDQDSFRDSWTMSDEFQYLVRGMAEQNISFSSFSLNNVVYDDRFDAWKKFLNEKVRGIILSYIQEPIRYYSKPYLFERMLDRMVRDGHMVPLYNMKKYSIPALKDVNYQDPTDLVNKKLTDTKDKFLHLYFLPAHRQKKGAARVYILCEKLNVSTTGDERYQAVSQIAQALEKQTGSNEVEQVEKHKDALDTRNRLIYRVKTSYNIKKDSHLKTGGRENLGRAVADKVMNISRTEGKLVLVFLCTPGAGVFRIYSDFLKACVEKRDKNDVVIVLVEGPDWKMTSVEQAVIKKFVPKELQAHILDKDRYIPYFKPKKNPWEFQAVMDTILDQSLFKMDRPDVKETFEQPKVTVA